MVTIETSYGEFRISCMSSLSFGPVQPWKAEGFKGIQKFQYIRVQIYGGHCVSICWIHLWVLDLYSALFSWAELGQLDEILRPSVSSLVQWGEQYKTVSYSRCEDQVNKVHKIPSLVLSAQQVLNKYLFIVLSPSHFFVCLQLY